MMARPKCHCRLNQQWFAVCRYFVGIMTAVNKEAPGLNWCQFTAHVGDPISFWQFRNRKRIGTHCCRQQRQSCFIRMFCEITSDFPKARTILNFKNPNSCRFRDQSFHRRAQRFGCRFSHKGRQRGECRHYRLQYNVSRGSARTLNRTSTATRFSFAT